MRSVDESLSVSEFFYTRLRARGSAIVPTFVPSFRAVRTIQTKLKVLGAPGRFLLSGVLSLSWPIAAAMEAADDHFLAGRITSRNQRLFTLLGLDFGSLLPHCPTTPSVRCFEAPPECYRRERPDESCPPLSAPSNPCTLVSPPKLLSSARMHALGGQSGGQLRA